MATAVTTPDRLVLADLGELHVGAAKAVDLGVTPFLVTDALKLAAAGLVLPGAWRLVRRFR